jgi:hypothetical protein
MALSLAVQPTGSATASSGSMFFEAHFVRESLQWSSYGTPIFDLIVDEGTGTPGTAEGIHGKTGSIAEIEHTINAWYPDLPPLEGCLHRLLMPYS